MENKREVLLALLRSALLDVKADERICSLAAQHAPELYRMAKHHDVAHMLAYAFDRLGISVGDAELSAQLKKQTMMAVFRYERTRYEQQAVTRLLEEQSIPYLPLKGAVLRELYPTPWMRTSCDIDILVPETELERAQNAIVSLLGYTTSGERDYHDVLLTSPTGVPLELHFHVKEGIEQLDGLLSHVWDHACPVAEGASEYRLSPEFLTFQIVAHMAYHFVHGGCGIRPLMDLYLLSERSPADAAILDGYLEQCSLTAFYKATLRLSRIWFGGDASHDELTAEMERYLLVGGTYGTAHTALLFRRRGKSRLSYALGRIFLSYDALVRYYPSLKGKRILTPLYQVRRWGSILLGGHAGRAARELCRSHEISDEQAKRTAQLLDELELNA